MLTLVSTEMRDYLGINPDKKFHIYDNRSLDHTSHLLGRGTSLLLSKNETLQPLVGVATINFIVNWNTSDKYYKY